MEILLNTTFKGRDLPKKDLRVTMDRAMRTSGLLAFLSPEDFQTLMALLTFVDESGRCNLSARTLAQMLNLSENQAQRRLKKLCGIRWHHRPLVIKENGREVGKFLPTGYQVMEVEGVKVIPDGTSRVDRSNGDGSRCDGSDVSRPSHANSSGDGSMGKTGEQNADASSHPVETANIQKRKSASGTPGTDVEGTPPDNTRITGNSCVGANNINNKHTTGDRNRAVKTDERKRILRELLKHGVSGSIASELLDRYPTDRIARQLETLPFRSAREPAAMLIKAVKEDWTAPAAYMSRQKKEAEQRTKAEKEAAEAEQRESWSKRVEEARAKLSQSELQEITRTAREKVRNALRGAFHGDAPERLVNVEVNRIIAKRYTGNAKT